MTSSHDLASNPRLDQSITTESIARVQEQVPACPVNLDLLSSVHRGWGARKNNVGGCSESSVRP